MTLGRVLGAADRPSATALVTGAAAAVFVLAQLAFVDLDPYRFVRIGDEFGDPARVPAGAVVLPGQSGYDGQFYYRIALDPFVADRVAFGITIDNGPFRHQRVLYPAIVWALSGGAAPFVPWLLIGVNLAGLIVVGWLAGRLSRASGRHALWGVGISFYPGFLITLARDLTEIVAACFFLGTLVLLRLGRPLIAAGTMSIGVLARETVLGLPVAVLAAATIDGVRRRALDARAFAFLLPLVVAVVWQTIIARAWAAPAFATTAAAFTGPGTGAFPGSGLELAFIWRSIHPRGDWVVFFVFLASATAIAARTFRRSSVPLHEKIAWIGYVAGAFALELHSWHMPNGFLRALTELGALNALVVLGTAAASPRIVLTALTVVAWLVMAALHAEV